MIRSLFFGNSSVSVDGWLEKRVREMEAGEPSKRALCHLSFNSCNKSLESACYELETRHCDYYNKVGKVLLHSTYFPVEKQVRK